MTIERNRVYNMDCLDGGCGVSVTTRLYRI